MSLREISMGCNDQAIGSEIAGTTRVHQCGYPLSPLPTLSLSLLSLFLSLSLQCALICLQTGGAELCWIVDLIDTQTKHTQMPNIQHALV